MDTPKKPKPLNLLIVYTDGRETLLENVEKYKFQSEYLHVTLVNEPENVLFAPYKNINFVVGRTNKQELLDILSPNTKTLKAS
jgi:hypothetical protein